MSLDFFYDPRPESAKQAERERIEAEERGELPMTLFGIPVIVDGKPIMRKEFFEQAKKATARKKKPCLKKNSNTASLPPPN